MQTAADILHFSTRALPGPAPGTIPYDSSPDESRNVTRAPLRFEIDVIIFGVGCEDKAIGRPYVDTYTRKRGVEEGYVGAYTPT